VTIFPEFEQELVKLAHRSTGTAHGSRRTGDTLDARGINAEREDARVDSAAQPANHQRSDRRGRPERPGRSPGWSSRLVAVALVAVTVAIVVAAVVMLRPAHRTGGGPPAVQSTLPSPARGVVGILGVLRRPQTQADRDLGPVLTRVMRQSRVGIPVMSLIRVAGIAPDGQKVVLVPMRPRNGAWPPGAGGPASGLRLGLFAGGGGCCSSPAAIEAGQGWSSAGSGSGNYVVLVVPDGVVRVTVAFSHPITAPVRNNIAVFAVPQAVENLSIYPMTWFGASGQVVKRFASSLPPAPTRGQTATQRARAINDDRRANVRTPPAILDTYALFRAGSPGGTFGAGAARFTVTRSPLAALPTFVLGTGSGPGYTMDVNNARRLTTPGGLQLWLLAGRVICIYGPSPQNAVCTTDPGSTSRFGLVSTFAPPTGPRLLIAVVPNSNRTIALATTTGPRTATVHDGIAVAIATGVTSVELKNSTGPPVIQRTG